MSVILCSACTDITRRASSPTVETYNLNSMEEYSGDWLFGAGYIYAISPEYALIQYPNNEYFFSLVDLQKHEKINEFLRGSSENFFYAIYASHHENSENCTIVRQFCWDGRLIKEYNLSESIRGASFSPSGDILLGLTRDERLYRYEIRSL